MVQITIEMPEEALGALRKAPQDFAREMRLVAAAKWYELKALSQERAAQIAGMSRAAWASFSSSIIPKARTES